VIDQDELKEKPSRPTDANRREKLMSGQPRKSVCCGAFDKRPRPSFQTGERRHPSDFRDFKKNSFERHALVTQSESQSTCSCFFTGLRCAFGIGSAKPPDSVAPASLH